MHHSDWYLYERYRCLSDLKFDHFVYFGGSRFSAFSGIVMVEAFAASAMGLTVGAIAPSTEAALALGPSLMTVFIVFGGYYVNSENTPTIFRWIPEVSLIRWYVISPLHERNLKE
jgi:hypothetical protein